MDPPEDQRNYGAPGINRRLWRRFVQYARDYEHNDFTMERLLACGIRDWGKDPYGAAVHVWKPRAKSWEVADAFTAFSLDGRTTNVHICGDAYSDYQGFIEGALRSAGRVLSYSVPATTTSGCSLSESVEPLHAKLTEMVIRVEVRPSQPSRLGHSSEDGMEVPAKRPRRSVATSLSSFSSSATSASKSAGLVPPTS